MVELELTDHKNTHRPDRWWVTALVAAVLAALVTLMVKLWPTATVTWVIGAAVVIFVVVMYFNPRHWLKRRSGTCLGFAGASAAVPAVAGALSLPQGWIEVSTSASPWVAGLFGVLALGFAYLDAWSKLPPAGDTFSGKLNSPTHGPNSPGTVIGPVTYHQGGVDPETFKKIVDRYERRISELEENTAAPLPLTEREMASVKAALARIESHATKTGDPKAREAIAEARRSGDLKQLDAALDAEFQRREDEIKEQATDWFDLCRESAAVAFIRGDIDKAQSRLEMVLQFFPDDFDATNHLGHIHVLRGRLAEAETSYLRVLELAAGDEVFEAVAYGNLGNVMQTRGDLDGAEEMYRKSLEIEEKLGRLEGMAINYGNLGIVMKTRGDLDGAEEMYRKSLEIEEKLGRLEGMASDYGNLGIVMKTRGNLDGAEEMYRKALEIEEKLGRLEGMARAYGNLGIVMQTRGDLDGAEEMHRKSLEINEKLGRLEGMASDYGNLGIVMKIRGDLDGAEEMYRKALEIDEKLGRLEGMANQYGNLGIVMKTRGDLDGARQMWTKSCELFEKLGAKHMVDKVQAWIDELED